jgi:hypothetical protein
VHRYIGDKAGFHEVDTLIKHYENNDTAIAGTRVRAATPIQRQPWKLEAID